jgi:predicted PurR-regulated permease PerM
MVTGFKIPFYAKASLIFIGLFAFVESLFLASAIIVPLIYSVIFAVALSPLVAFFMRKKMGKVLAISLTLTLTFLSAIILIIFISTQLDLFVESLPKLLDKMYLMLDSAAMWSSRNFNVSPQKVGQMITDTKKEVMNSGISTLSTTLTSVGNALVVLVLIPVYVFLILFYESLLIEFIRRLLGTNSSIEIDKVLLSTKEVIQKYLLALLFEAGIVATMNSVGLLIIGIDYAIVLGVIGAILNIIPYIGGIIAVALPMLVACVTKSSSSYMFLVLGVYLVIQFIDNNYIIPKIVASRVRINALVSVIVVIAYGALWGIPGMFLSIPLTAIFKVMCDHIEQLRPWGFLLGDSLPPSTVFKINIKKLK